MFGFLSAPCSGCLGTGPQQIYRSYFCGLCNRLRQDYGLWSRWLINRDSTFLSLLGAAQQRDCPETVCTTCCNPFGKNRELHQNGPAVDYAAAITICGLAVKVHDDMGDEGRIRRWGSRIASSFLAQSVEKARAVLEDLDFPAESVREHILKQQDVEKRIPSGGSLNLESAASPTAESYSQILKHTAFLPNALTQNSTLLEKLGWSLGAMIYWFDAWEDYESDIRHRRFNPLQFATSNRRPRIQDRLAFLRPLLEMCRRDFANLAHELRLNRHQRLIHWISTTGVRTRLGPLVPAVLMSQIDQPEFDGEEERKEDQAPPACCWCDCDECACFACRMGVESDSCCCDCDCG